MVGGCIRDTINVLEIPSNQFKRTYHAHGCPHEIIFSVLGKKAILIN